MATSAKKVTNEWNIAKDKYDSNMREMIVATEQLDDAIGALEVSKELGDTEGIIKLRNEIDLLESQIAPLSNNVDKFGIAMEIAGNKANNITQNITGSTVQTTKLDKGMKKVEKSTRNVSNATNNVSSGISKGIKRLGKYALALFGIRAAYNVLRRLSQQWLDSDDAGAKQVKSNLQAISSALSNALAPIITYIANIFVTIVAYANALLKAFFGIDLLSKGTAKNTNKINSGAKKVTKELKKWTGSFDKADIASSSIADNMDSAGSGSGAMDLPTAVIPAPDLTGLFKAFDTIKSAFLDIWNSEQIQSMLSSLKTIFTNVFWSLVSITSNVFDNIFSIFDLMAPHLQRGIDNALSFWSLFLNDLADFTDEWLPKITDSFNTLVDSIFETFSPLFEFISQLWADIWEIMLELWEEHGKDLLDKAGEMVTNVLDVFDGIWDLIDTIISPILDIFKEVWDNTLKDTLKDVLSFVMELWGYALDIYNKFIAPILKFLLGQLQPGFAVVFGTIGGIVTGAVNLIVSSIGNTINTIRGVLEGLIDFISGVFTGDWSKAWKGVTKIFGSIFNGIKEMAKMPINFIIDSINGFLRGINKIKIPSWVPGVGGKGFSIPTIPRLYKGGVLREETLNVAGEYAGARTNPEIMTPQNIMRDTFEDVLSRMGNMGRGGNETINLVVSGEKLASVLRNEDEKNNFMMNGGMNFGTI